MACPGTPCTTITVPPGWSFSPNPVAPSLQDDRLIGLAEQDITGGTRLVIVDPETGTLGTAASPKGIWQHNPAVCGGDFVGPLNDPPLSGIPAPNTAKAQHLLMLESDCDGANQHFVKAVAGSGTTGLPLMLRGGVCASGVKPVTMAPEILDTNHSDAGGVLWNLRMLGYITESVEVSTGVFQTQYKWFSSDRVHQAAVPQVEESDTTETVSAVAPNLQYAMWRKVTGTGGGTGWELAGIPEGQIPGRIRRSSLDMLDEQFLIYEQTTTPGNNPVTESENYDLHDQPTWNEEASGVILFYSILGSTVTRDFDIIIRINGQQFARMYVNLEMALTDTAQVIIKNPPTGIVTVSIEYVPRTGSGTPANCSIKVYLGGFIY